MKRTELPMVHVYYVESLRISAPQAAVHGSKSYAELVLDMRRFDWTLFLVLRIVASICVIGQVTDTRLGEWLYSVLYLRW